MYSNDDLDLLNQQINIDQNAWSDLNSIFKDVQDIDNTLQNRLAQSLNKKPSSDDILNKIIYTINKSLGNMTLELIAKILNQSEFNRVFQKLPKNILDILVNKYYS